MTLDKALSPTASPIAFRLDPASGVPTYLQLVQQVEHALRLGYLKPGDRLPKVREVVADLAINPNTVLKAYRDLEQKGRFTDSRLATDENHRARNYSAAEHEVEFVESGFPPWLGLSFDITQLDRRGDRSTGGEGLVSPDATRCTCLPA